LQRAAIARFGLVDTGLEWRVAHSGRTVYRTSVMAAMMAAARRGEFDVLLVGYVSRWQRNLRRTLELLEDALHPAGVAVYFCDEEILSSCERHWDQLVDEAKDAERYSRRLSKRVREGYASKRSRDRDPGGHPPFGFRRNEAKLLEPDPERVATVRRAYELSAAGYADREVAQAVAVPLFTVRGLLTSPLYVGRLRDGAAGHWRPIISESLWQTVQTRRAVRATKTGKPADPRRPYALDMLHCAGCGKRLTGDTGYYRHREPCEAFVEARPEDHPRRGRSNGHAYHMDLYEQIVASLLAEAAVAAPTVASVVGATAPSPAITADTLASIERERERALLRYRRDRDAAALERTMDQLDHRERASEVEADSEAVPPDVAVQYLRELPETWARASGGRGRQLLASALFDRIEVLGVREATVHLTAHAVRHGLAAALPERVDLPVYGRGERT
jgi:DNA invertase Pin-like site-specific DNA recombinase